MLQCYRQYASITFNVLILSVDLVIGCVRLAKHLLEDGEASALGNDTKIVIKSSLQVTFSHVHDYVGWFSVQSS